MEHFADPVLEEVSSLRQEIATLKHEHEAEIQQYYDRYRGQMKKIYDFDVSFERNQRIMAQELAAKATETPDDTHDLCNKRHQILDQARSDAFNRHNQDVQEKRELQERLASLEFENDGLRAKTQEQSYRENKLVEALVQSNERVKDLTAHLCKVQPIMGLMRDNGSQTDIPDYAESSAYRARIQERLMQENETVHSQLLTEKKKNKNLRNELNKEKQRHGETQTRIQREARDSEYYKAKLEAKKDVVTKNNAIWERIIVRGDEQLENMHRDLTKWHKQLGITDKRLDVLGNGFKDTEKKSAHKPAADVALKPATQLVTTPESTTSQPAAVQNIASNSSDSVVDAPNGMLALAKHVERLEATIQSQSREAELKLLRKLVGNKKAHEALEAQVAAHLADKAEQARRLADKEAEVRRLRNRLEQRPSWGCEEHDAELRRLTHKLDRLKGLSVELTGHIDEGSDALKKCGDAMKEHLRRL